MSQIEVSFNIKVYPNKNKLRVSVRIYLGEKAKWI